MKSAAFKKTYGSQTAISVPELEWKAGVIYAVIGANGSGKSTLAKILSGVLRSDSDTRVISEERIGYLPQKPYAFRMRAEKNLYLNGADHDRAEALMTALGLDALRRKQAHHLSGGETAKLALARLLMRDYELLILDEPTAAMDMESTLAAESLIQRYRDNSSCAVILITHSLQQARRIADQILYLEQGELIEAGEAESMLKCPSEPATKRFLHFFGFENL